MATKPSIRNVVLAVSLTSVELLVDVVVEFVPSLTRSIGAGGVKAEITRVPELSITTNTRIASVAVRTEGRLGTLIHAMEWRFFLNAFQVGRLIMLRWFEYDKELGSCVHENQTQHDCKRQPRKHIPAFKHLESKICSKNYPHSRCKEWYWTEVQH